MNVKKKKNSIVKNNIRWRVRKNLGWLNYPFYNVTYLVYMYDIPGVPNNFPSRPSSIFFYIQNRNFILE